MRSSVLVSLLIHLAILSDGFIGERETKEPPLAGPPMSFGKVYGQKESPVIETHRADPSAYVLTPDVWFVLDTDSECCLTSSKLGLIRITKEPGPIRVKGRFVQAPNEIQTREYTKKFVYTIEPVKDGECELLAWVIGTKDEKDIQRIQLVCGKGPRPPPADPLVAAIKAAYDADGDSLKAVHLGKLTNLYREAAKSTVKDSKIKTWGQLHLVIQTARKSEIGEGLPGVRDELGKRLFAAKWPVQTDAAFDQAARTLAESVLNTAANLLEAIR